MKGRPVLDSKQKALNKSIRLTKSIAPEAPLIIVKNGLINIKMSESINEPLTNIT